jgi:hypothetical protein
MPVNNYQSGAYESPWAGQQYEHAFKTISSSDYNVPLGNDQRLQGPVDWNNLSNVQGHVRDLETLVKTSKSMNRYFQANPDKDTTLGRRIGSEISPNPFYSQGLGPEDYDGMYESDRAANQLRWWEATQTKFLQREQELQGIASAPATEGFGAGTQGAYDAQQTARESLGKPVAEGARSAELLRQNRAPRAGGGTAPAGAGRQAGRAQAAEGRRLASNDRTTGSGSGGTAKRKLRAASLTRQPLGAGSQSAAQLLG